MLRTQDAHDQVAYPAHAYPATHPDTLAVIAMLHGLEATPVAHCRVLEVGCNEGANLIPMAYAIPGGEFVGFDIANLPIDRGHRRIAELGLTNIRLFQADLLDVGDAIGSFDYIIAHGVYTWVAEPVRERLLALCRQHLAPNGVAFISYNALPGGHLKNMLRDILQQGMAGTKDPVEGVTQGFQLLRFVIESRPKDDSFRSLLEKELKRLESRGPHAVFHDELSSDYSPVSFTDFMTRAAAHNLRFLDEATLPSPNDIVYKPNQVNAAKALAHGDPIMHEQVLDNARVRMYRETLLCHAERPISSDLSINLLGRMDLASPCAASPGEGGVLRVYTLPDGIRMESSHLGTVVLMDHLVEAWPGSVSFADLVQFLAANHTSLDAELFRLLFQLIVSRMVKLHAWVAPVNRTIAARPMASATARLEAVTSTEVTTLRHSTLVLEDIRVRQLLLLLDGTRDRAALLQALLNQNPEVPESALAEGLEASLQLLNRSGVVLAER